MKKYLQQQEYFNQSHDQNSGLNGVYVMKGKFAYIDGERHVEDSHAAGGISGELASDEKSL